VKPPFHPLDAGGDIAARCPYQFWLFSETSPVCFRPAFDGIQEAWLNRKQDSGGVPSFGYPSKWADSRISLPESAISTQG
jgi:hypothetical protein